MQRNSSAEKEGTNEEDSCEVNQLDSPPLRLIKRANELMTPNVGENNCSPSLEDISDDQPCEDSQSESQIIMQSELRDVEIEDPSYLESGEG